MKKIAWGTLLITLTFTGMILNIGIASQRYEYTHQNNPISSSNSDSWSKIVKEDRGLYFSRCELVNDSLYIIGEFNLYNSIQHSYIEYLYVSKLDLSGNKEWERSFRLNNSHQISYVFDNDDNLIIISENCCSDKMLIIKLNSSGILLFSNILSLNMYELSIVLGENNTFLIAGEYTTSYPAGILRIIQFNTTGQIIRETTLRIETEADFGIVKASANNLYLYFMNNSIFKVAKLNEFGAIVWQTSIENIDLSSIFQLNLIVDSDDNLFIFASKNYTIGFILKINSTGQKIKEVLVGHYDIFSKIVHFGDLVMYNFSNETVLCFDLDLDLKWKLPLSAYINPRWNSWRLLAEDSQGNVFFIQDNTERDLDLVKISSSGDLMSKFTWGGRFEEKPNDLVIDLDDNIYFVCLCEGQNRWNDVYQNEFIRYTVLTKNPVYGGYPPSPKVILDFRDYFLFSVLGISSLIALVVLIFIVRKRKDRGINV
jgi:hypothetical protein